MIHRYPIRSNPISKWVPSIVFNGIQDWLCLRLLKSWEVHSTVSWRGLTISYRLAWNSDRRGSALCWEKQCSTESISVVKVWNLDLRGENIFSFSVVWSIILQIGHTKTVKTWKTQTCRSRKIRKILTSTFVWKGSKAKKSIEERAFAS